MSLSPVEQRPGADPSAAAHRTLPPLEQPASRTDRVRDGLRRAILDGTLQPGRPLVERELAEMLGVSKTPVREALKQLQSSGLVEINAYQGVSVRRLDATTVRELYVARSVVEPVAVRMATEQHDETHITNARRALEEAQALLRDGESAALSMANRRFHRALYSVPSNAFLCDFLDQLQDLTAFVATVGWRQRNTARDEAAEHVGILEAIEHGDAELAEQRTRQHIDTSAQTILNALANRDAT